MFESIINPKKAERHPAEMFLIGFFYASLSMLIADVLFIGNNIFEEHLSLLIITFTVMFSSVFVYFTIRYEEKKDTYIQKETSLLREHARAIMCFIYLFLGFVMAFSFAYVLLPQDIVNKNFDMQIKQFCDMNMPGQFTECVDYHTTGKAVEPTSRVISSKPFNNALSIFSHNISVMIFCLLFSLLFGLGAIFILVWNSSVIAVAMGIFAESRLIDIPSSILRYLIHGIPEIAAYFIIGLAGGIISVAVIRHDFRNHEFWRILKDSLWLTLIAFIVLFLAALIEVFITPAIF